MSSGEFYGFYRFGMDKITELIKNVDETTNM